MNFGKRIDRPGGGRRALREDVVISAAMMTTSASLVVDLLNLSKTGARFQGRNLPAPGQEVMVLLGRLEAFGTIVWREDGQCGVHFDVALSERAVSILESECSPSAPLGMGSDAVLASVDWATGLAR